MTPVTRTYDIVSNANLRSLFSWNAGSWMCPAMLRRLPELPPELEYRFVGRDLVLIDIPGSVVVDVLRDAVPTIETAPVIGGPLT